MAKKKEYKPKESMTELERQVVAKYVNEAKSAINDGLKDAEAHFMKGIEELGLLSKEYDINISRAIVTKGDGSLKVIVEFAVTDAWAKKAKSKAIAMFLNKR